MRRLVRAGDVFGLLTVVAVGEAADFDKPGHGTQAQVRCACGRRRVLPARRLGRDYVSCGCANPNRLWWAQRSCYWPTALARRKEKAA